MNTHVAQLISAAEKEIEERRYRAALDHLVAAERIEPDNKSIRMTKELVKSLQAERPRRSPFKRFLPLTIYQSNQDEGGEIMSNPPTGIQRRVRRFTSSAEYFLARGAVDEAFESLMRAYLLDPLAPEVLVCEQRVLPAWQKLHGKTPEDVKKEWNLRVASQQPKANSSLFEKMRLGKLFE